MTPMRMRGMTVKTSRSKRRVDLLRILASETLREELFVGVIITLQAREGITTTREQALRAYRKIRKERLRQ
jgi:hypothetical protein